MNTQQLKFADNHGGSRNMASGQNTSSGTAGPSNQNNNLLTASLNQKVSSLKSLSDAFKEMQQNNDKHSRQQNESALQVNGTAAPITQTFGAMVEPQTKNVTNASEPLGGMEENIQRQVDSFVPSNEYARIMAQGVITNLNTDLTPVDEMRRAAGVGGGEFSVEQLKFSPGTTTNLSQQPNAGLDVHKQSQNRMLMTLQATANSCSASRVRQEPP